MASPRTTAPAASVERAFAEMLSSDHLAEITLSFSRSANRRSDLSSPSRPVGSRPSNLFGKVLFLGALECVLVLPKERAAQWAVLDQLARLAKLLFVHRPRRKILCILTVRALPSLRRAAGPGPSGSLPGPWPAP